MPENTYVPSSLRVAGGSVPKRAVLAITHFVLIVASSLLLCLSGCSFAETDDATASLATPSQPTVAVRTARIVRGDVVAEFTLVGTVTSIRRSVVGSPVDGRVTTVNVEAGDLVTTAEEGESPPPKPMVRLSTETIDIEIAAANAELSRLQYELDELKVGNRPEEIARSRALWEAAKVASEVADLQFKRVEQLRLNNAISTADFEAAKSAAQSASQTMIAAKADYDLMMAGPRSEDVAQAMSQLEKQRQEVSRLNVLRSHHTINAPFEGYVAEKHTEAGQWLSRGDPVAEVVSLDPIDVMVHVPESIVNELRIGDAVPLHVPALPDDMENLTGKIHGIGPSADQRARTFPIRIRLQNPERGGSYLLRDGMQARATISGAPRSTLIVPKDALVLGGRTPVVMVASTADDGKTIASKVDVETGVARESTVEVRGDLQAGQYVVVDGNERVRAGQAVRVVNKALEGRGGNQPPANASE